LDGRPVAPDLLERMTQAVSHRGPDGAGLWRDGTIGLGHRLLHSTPESAWESSPSTSPEGSLVITADARLDNRQELIAELSLDGKSRSEIPDPEIILEAYEKWGEDCPNRLIGDFAFALWDRRRQRLFCARDPMGIKPFYYYWDGRKLLLASEIRQILKDPAVALEPNRQTVTALLLDRVPAAEETLYEGVSRLPPGCALVAEHGSIRTRPYWDFCAKSGLRYRSEDQYVEHFRELFAEAVQSRLRSHGPVAALLSGGLDSSAIVGMAQELYRQRKASGAGFETYSLVFDTLPCDERPYIEEVVRKWGLPANPFAVESEPGWLDFERALEYPDLLYRVNHYMMLGLLAQARRRGAKVCLWGLGGDDLLASGFFHLTDLARTGRFLELLRALREATGLYDCRLHELIRDYCIAPFVPASLKAWLRPLLAFRGRRHRIVPRLYRRLLARAGPAELARHGRHEAHARTYVQRAMVNSLRFGRLNPALAQMDLLGAHFSMEFRHPFCDRRIVEFILGLPAEWAPLLLREKGMLRQALKEVLPDSVRERRDKADFTPCLERELRFRQVDRVESLIQNSRLAFLGLADRQRLYNVFRDYRRAASPDVFEQRAIETVVALELWLQAFELAKIERKRRDGSEANVDRNHGGEESLQPSDALEVR
jgi:asparagine synthase (glutamine-hydrolysing)